MRFLLKINLQVNFIGIFTTNVAKLPILPTSPTIATHCGQQASILFMGRRNSPLAHPSHANAACPRLLRLPADEKFHPIQIDFFSAQAIVQITNALADLAQKAD